MNFDRGFIKWQPFNSVVPNKMILNSLNQNKKIAKPTFFPEKLEQLEELIKEAYYSKNEITITFYEQNNIKKVTTKISKIDSNQNIIYLENHKIVTFNQILNIENNF